MKKHPMQRVVLDKNGVPRFQCNSEYLLEHSGIENRIAMMNFKDEDRMQLAQLVGYSVSGYGSLDYVTMRSRNAADKRALKAMEH